MKQISLDKSELSMDTSAYFSRSAQYPADRLKQTSRKTGIVEKCLLRKATRGGRLCNRPGRRQERRKSFVSGEDIAFVRDEVVREGREAKARGGGFTG